MLSKFSFDRLFKLFLYSGIIANILMCFWLLTYSDIIFQTDIARDFLLIEDIVYKNHFTLLGPRSGGIPGVFHGPLWLYLQVPAFILAHGDPAKMSIFWILMCLIGLYIAYRVTTRLFGSDVALISVFLISCTLPTTFLNLFNPYGAVILAPLFFYYYYLYIKTSSIRYILLSLLFLGLSIQFQMAWSIPIIILTVPIAISKLYRSKSWIHIFSYFILVLPLLSYIVFELRHSFLQINSAIHHMLGGNNGYGVTSLYTYFLSRLSGVAIEGWYLFSNFNTSISLLLLMCVLIYIYRSWCSFTQNTKLFYSLYIYFYLGFWCITFLFRGIIWGGYYWPFLHITAIAIGLLYVQKNRILPMLLICLIGSSYLLSNIKYIVNFKYFSGNDLSSWKFNQQVVDSIFSQKDKVFGYYIFNPDQYGFSLKYAMNYAQRLSKQVKSFPFQKQKITYLLMAPAPDYRPELNGDWWRSDQVRIKRNADSRTTYPNGLKIEKYNLSDEEVEVSSDPNLIQDLHFR